MTCKNLWCPWASKRLLDCAREPGASTWLSALPMEELGFCLCKSLFRDALSLRYGWQLTNLSSKCTCGKSFAVDHAMMCHKGGLATLRHNEVRDWTAALLAETCTGVSIEPPLQAFEDEEFNFRSSNRDETWHQSERHLVKRKGSLFWR